MAFKRITGLLASTLVLAIAAAPAIAQTQRGVKPNEIIVGTILDLSGPAAYAGKQGRNGLQMRIDEANAAGGINGRQIRLLVEDNAYDPKRAVLAAQKLVQLDDVFAVLYQLGSAHNVASMPILFENKVINFMPASGSRQMFDPPERLKLAVYNSYHAMMEQGVPALVKKGNHKKVCALYIDDEGGQEHLRGTEDGLKSIGMTLTERASAKRGSIDFQSQVLKLKEAGCTMVALGTLVRETAGVMAEARKIGFTPDFIGSDSVHSATLIQLGGASVDGLYASRTFVYPYPDHSDARVAKWARDYKAKFNEDAAGPSMYGYYVADVFIAAAKLAGRNITTDGFLDVMEQNKFASPFGGEQYEVSKTNRLGLHKVGLSRVENGKWVVQP